MKSIVARFQELKQDVAGTAASEFEDLDYNKVDTALKSVGVSLKDATGQFRNFDDVILDLGKKWSGLSRNQQRYVATIAAGSRQQSRFLALLSDYDRTLELVNVATNSAGRANEQFAKYADTVEYRVNKLKNTWEEFRTSLVGSEQVKVMLTATRAVLSFATSITNSYIKLIPTLISVFTLFQKIKKIVPTAKNITNAFLEAYKDPKVQANLKLDGSGAGADIKKDMEKAADYSGQRMKEGIIEGSKEAGLFKEQKEEVLGESSFNDDKKANIEIPELNIKSGPDITSEELNEALDETAEKTKSFGQRLEEGSRKFGAAFQKIIPYIKGGASAITVGMMAGSFINEIYETINDSKQEAYDAAVAASQASHNISEYKTAYNSTKNLDEARKAVIDLSNKTYLSAEEEEKLQESIDLFRDKYPEYVKSYDENTGKLILLTDKLDEQIEEQKKNNQLLLSQNLGKVAYGREAGYGALKNKINDNTYTTSGIGEFINNNTKEIALGGAAWTTLAGYAVGSAAAAGTTAGAGAAAAGAAIGTTAAPIIGTIIGAAIGLGVALITNAISSNTTTTEEFIQQLTAMDSDTQKVILEKISETQGQSISTIGELSIYLNDNKDKLEEIGKVTSDILAEVKKRAGDEDRLRAAQEYMSTWTFGEDEEGLPTTLIERGHHKASTTTEKFGSKLVNVVDENLSEVGNWTRGSSIDEMADAFKSVGKLAELKSIEDTLDEIDKLPETFGEGMTSAQKKTLEILEPFWDQFKNQDEDDITAVLLQVLASVWSGEDLREELDKEVKPLYEKIATSDSPIIKEILDVVENFTTKAQSMTFKEMQEEEKRLLSMVQNLSIGDNNKENTQIRQILTDYITGKTANGYDQNSFGEAEKTLTNKLGEFKKYFDEKIVDTMSVESLSIVDKLVSSTLDSEKWKQIAAIINEALKQIPENVDEITRTSMTNYIFSQMTPENFDDGKIVQYTDDLAKMSHNYELAITLTNNMWAAYRANNIDTVKKSFDELNTSMEDNVKSLKTVISDWSSFEKAFKSSLTKSGTNPSDLLAIAESEYYSALSSTGEVDLKTGINLAVMRAVEFQSQFYSSYQKMLTEAAGDALKIEQAKKWWNAIQPILEAFKYQALDSAREIGEEITEQLDKAQREYNNAVQAKVRADKKLRDAQKEYDAARTGDPYWVPSIDAAFNVNEAIKDINQNLDITDLKLKDIKDTSEALELINQRNVDRHELEVEQRAKLLALQEAQAKKEAELEEFAKGYGITDVSDMSQVLTAAIPQKAKEYIQESLTTLSGYKDSVRDIEKTLLTNEQKYNDELKDNLNKRVSFLKKGADIMKEAAEKEVKDLKNKYDAMKDADDQYLDALEDAIKKQRNLREREKEANDLAQKEKKLSLISRDTSGANEKERLKLEKELQTDRQKYLDNTVDDIIDELKRQSEEREKERQAVIDATEAINESTNWVQQFCDIANSWTSTAQAEAWFLETSPDLKNKTAEEKQQLSNELIDSFKESLPYLAQNMEGYKEIAATTAEEVAKRLDERNVVYEEYDQAKAKKAAHDIEEDLYNTNNSLEDAKQSLDNAKRTEKEKLKDLNEANEAYGNYQKQAKDITPEYLKGVENDYYKLSAKEIAKIDSSSITNTAAVLAEQIKGIVSFDNLTRAELLTAEYQKSNNWTNKQAILQKAGQEGYSYVDGAFRVNQTGINQIPELVIKENQLNEQYKNIKDGTSQNNFIKNAEKQGFTYRDGKFHAQLLDSLESSGAYYKDTWINRTNLGFAGGADQYMNYMSTPPISEEQIKEDEEKKRRIDPGYVPSQNKTTGTTVSKKYASGGLVSYTGPAWVDGSPTRPEAFLSPEDTRRIGEAAKLLSLSPFFNSSQTPVSSSVGDTSVEININVEQISSDYDVDQLVERIHQDILDAARPTGTPVILRKN